MARYELLIKPSARRELERIREKDRREALVTAIRSLATCPRPTGCVKLSGTDPLWRIRCGDHRVIYEVLERVLTITVICIGSRRQRNAAG